ncbi:hypothetical protein Murru_1503 [Allomuricauda ruestringensis DSM 13258]|uniref:Uncharacterized protein n=1 Tax=Allomuricauda ruestringensis (strain DSM 13258 / CIP 107369 / LMG 19739 / B1) TaxID=886377 RepID=G2PQE9_ALLRU|nr:hypothetical protein Murru_1503 [Allomuricauda ruestringensis DSM 13258]
MPKIIGIAIGKQTFDVYFKKENKMFLGVCLLSPSTFKKLIKDFPKANQVVMETFGPF